MQRSICQNGLTADLRRRGTGLLRYRTWSPPPDDASSPITTFMRGAAKFRLHARRVFPKAAIQQAAAPLADAAASTRGREAQGDDFGGVWYPIEKTASLEI